MKSRWTIYWAVCAPILLMMATLGVCKGAVEIPLPDVWRAIIGDASTDSVTHFIVVESRSAAVVTALISGAGIAVSGLLLQFLFRNELAGPSVLGISSGAGIGVAIVTLGVGSGITVLTSPIFGHLTIVVCAIIGAICSTLIILAVSSRMTSDVMVLVVGIMIGQIASSVVALMSIMATADGLRNFVMWGMGSFTTVSWSDMLWLAVPILLATTIAMMHGKSLNAVMLGANYAANLGVNSRRLRHIVLLLACTPVAVVTAFCGPIALLGLAMPHVARLSLRTDDFRYLLPATAMAGALAALVCQIISNVAIIDGQMMPINVLMPIICSPIIIYIILRK